MTSYVNSFFLLASVSNVHPYHVSLKFRLPFTFLVTDTFETGEEVTRMSDRPSS